MLRINVQTGFIRRRMASSTRGVMGPLCSVSQPRARVFFRAAHSVSRTQIYWWVSSSDEQDEERPRNLDVQNSWGAGRSCWGADKQRAWSEYSGFWGAQGRGVGRILQVCRCRADLELQREATEGKFTVCKEKSVQGEVCLTRNESSMSIGMQAESASGICRKRKRKTGENRRVRQTEKERKEEKGKAEGQKKVLRSQGELLRACWGLTSLFRSR